MTQIKPNGQNARKHARRGVKRVMVHIILFFVLCAVLVVMGITGTRMLNTIVKNSAVPQKIAVYTDKKAGIETGLKAMMLEVVGDDKTLVNTVNNNIFSAKRKAVNDAITDGMNAGQDDESALNTAAQTYVSRAEEVLSGKGYIEQAALIKERAANEMPQTIAALIEAGNAASASVNAAMVKAELNVTQTEHYALIYYGQALLIIGICCGVFALFLLILWLTRDEDGRALVGEKLEPFDYLLPFLIGVGIFTVYPMIRVLLMSFQEKYTIGKNGTGTFTSWGFGNYAFILTGSASDQFLRSLRNTALYVLFTVPITAAIAIVVAYLLNQKSRLNSLFQTAYFLPMVTTATAVGLVWRWMFNKNFGLFNALIGFFTQFFNAPTNVDWLQTGGSNPVIPMTVLIVFGIWNSLPFTIILLLSGLQNIDENLYTVAKVDGSGPMRIFFKITVPLLSPTIGLVLIINSISAFKVYTDVFVLWNGYPEHYQMETVAWYIYNNINGSDGLHYTGLAASAAMVLFVIIFVFTMVQKYIQRKWVYQ